MYACICEIGGEPSKRVCYAGHRPEPCLLASEDPPLLLAGDAFGGPKVEGAALSGLAAADRLLNRSEG
jgi:predicted NAD/FAD-dependent oxidoreductase